MFVQISFPLIGDLTLVRGFTVSAVNFLYHVHAARHLAKGGEAHGIELRIIPEIDE